MTSVRPRRIGGNIAYWSTARECLLDAIGPDVVKFFDDFVQSPLASADAPSGWTVTLVEAGSGESTITKVDGSAGELLITTDANEDDGVAMQLAGEAFGFSTSQTATYFGIRLKASDATQSDFLVGLCITDTTLLGGMSDGVYFEKLDGGTGISFTTEKNATETQTDSLATFAANTYVTLEFYGDSTSVRAYIDGSLVATHTTNICDDELLTPSIQFLAGAAAIKTLTIDWVRAIQVGR
jgi:hypothetical protein